VFIYRWHGGISAEQVPALHKSWIRLAHALLHNLEQVPHTTLTVTDQTSQPIGSDAVWQGRQQQVMREVRLTFKLQFTAVLRPMKQQSAIDTIYLS